MAPMPLCMQRSCIPPIFTHSNGPREWLQAEYSATLWVMTNFEGAYKDGDFKLL